MEQKFNSFDNQIKDAYEGHEMPYDRSSWDSLSSKLDAMAPAPVTYFTALTTGLVAVGIIFLSLLFILSEKNQTPDPAANNEARVEVQSPADDNENGKITLVASDSTEAIDDALTDDQIESDEVSEIAEAHNVNGTTHAAESTVAERDSDSTDHITESRKKSASYAVQTSKADPSADGTPTKPELITGNKAISSTESSNNRTVRTSCTGITINFDASEDYGSDAKYLWNFGDGFFSNESNPSHTFNKPGTFDVSLSVTSHTTGQITSNVVQAMIEVIEAPRARMSVHIASPSEIEVENISIGDDSAEWMVDSETISAGTVALVPFAPGAQNEIKLVALNQSGCADTLTKHLNFKEIAETLSVEGDAPFLPAAKEGTEFTKLYIFEAATGNKVFQSADGEGWDMTQTAPGDEFIFLAVVKEKDRTEVHRGTVVRK